MDCFALLCFPAPTFCDTNDAMDCINALGTSMAKLTILQATPYPEDASKPSLLINAHNARKDICVKNSWSAKGRPTLIKRLHCLLILKSCFWILKSYFFLFNIIMASTTLTACAITVAIAAPAASSWKPATKIRSPIIFTAQATATKINGDLLSPNPLKIAANTLYATIKKIPPPHILT